MRLSDIFSTRFLKWSLIGVAVAGVSDVALSFIFMAADSALEPPTLGIIKVVSLVVMTALALVLIGERNWLTVGVSSVATVVGFLIGAAHLAALSIGVAVITLGERIERGHLPTATPRRASHTTRRGRRPRPPKR